jgi:hypothetical protein
MRKFIAKFNRKPLGSFRDDAIGWTEKLSVLRYLYLVASPHKYASIVGLNRAQTHNALIQRSQKRGSAETDRHTLHWQWYIVRFWQAQHTAPPAPKTIHTTVQDLLHPSKNMLGQWSLYVPPGLTLKKPYVLPYTVCLCVLCGSENKQRLFPYTALTDWIV